jgi:multidrug efflux pump subunit AcrB
VSIGLLVDFIMHVMLRYYESLETTRDDKVKDTLKTIGVSILVGGLSTFTAVIPLAFSTSAIIGNVFTSFFAMVTLGVAHGLIFLPVVLSMVGPTQFPRLHPAKTDVNDAETKFESRLNSEDQCNESISSYATLEATSPMTTIRYHDCDEHSSIQTIVEV